MKAWLFKSGRGWLPADEEAQELHSKMGSGEAAEFRIVRPRSVKMHRMFFGIAREIGRNQDPPRSEDSIVAELKVRAGHFDVLVVDGHDVRVPKSIAFERLTHDEWMQLWPSFEEAISSTFGFEYIAELGRAA